MTGVKVQKGVKVCSRQYAVGSCYLSQFSCFLLLTACCLLLTVFTGCQQGTPPQPPAQQAKKEAPKPVAATPAVEIKEEIKKEETAITAKQRNPFKSFIVKVTEKPAVAVPKTPLQRYELEQLKLVAIIWGVNSSIAMVEAPDGKGYSIRKGDLIGNRNGKVRRIEKDRVVVEERFAEASGEVTTNEFLIKLPLPKGEEEVR